MSTSTNLLYIVKVSARKIRLSKFYLNVFRLADLKMSLNMFSTFFLFKDIKIEKHLIGHS